MNYFRSKAVKLRKKGYSYGMIRDELEVPKSTLSNWLSRIPFKPNKKLILRIGKARLKSALYKQRIKFEDISQMKREADREVGELSSRDLFMLGVGLYLGEGSKSQEEIRVVNSDPIILKLAIKWFKRFSNIKTEHLRVAIHCYPDNNISKIKNFWSRELKIPANQFIKTQIDIRENKSKFKRRKLPYGTAHLYIRGGGTLHPGVRSLHRKIMGYIDAVSKQI